MIEQQFQLFADYFQFYLQDEECEGMAGTSWTEAALEARGALEECAFSVTTARNMMVPVVLRIFDDEPNLDLDS